MDNDILNLIYNVLKKYLDENKYKFFLYGSRAKGNWLSRSDYDIGVIGEKKLETEIYLNIKEDFESIPALIDFIDFSQVSESFKKEAMKNIIYLN